MSMPSAMGEPNPVVRPSVLQRLVTIWRDEYDTAVNWPRGIQHLVFRAIVITVVDTAALVLTAWLLPQVTIDHLHDAVLLVVLAGLLTFLLRPAAFLVLPQSIITTSILTILFSGLTLALADRLVRGVHFDNVVWIFLTALLIAAVNSIVIPILGLDEDESFYRNSLRKLARATGDVDDRPGPGFLIIQVDGLAEPIIKHAVRTGYMPFLARWLRDGTYKLGTWEALAPSMTTSGQTGILHGNNAGIPAFRWWEKDRNYLMVSNHPDDAFEIERRASGERDLLRDGGASISNLVSGGAPRCVATNSQLSSKGKGLQVEGLSLYLVNPYNISRGVAAFLWTVVVEYFQARAQRQRGVEPRIGRGMPFPVLRASTSTVLRDMVTDLVIGEMYRGTPIIYADYLGYDEVAHHAGPERPEKSMAELIKVDRQIRTFARAAEGAPRRYFLVLLSDHGQSQGAPFQDRYRESLENVVRKLMAGEASLLAATGDAESWGPVNAFFTEVVRSTGRTGNLARRAFRERGGNDMVQMGPDARQHRDMTQKSVRGEDVPDLVVAASGNLANLYFTDQRTRMTLEDIEAAHPGLVAGLVRHPGIGFAMVRSERLGALAIGREGVVYLEDGRVEGSDPLTEFGPHARDNLRRLDTFANVGDILVNSMYDSSTEEIAPFEHQVGAHGGLGGPQTRAFLMYPSALEPADDPIALVGAEAVNAKLHEWIERAKSGIHVGFAPGTAGLAPEVAAVIGSDGHEPAAAGGGQS